MLCSKRPPPSPASKLVLPADGEARSAQRFHKESREAVQHPFSQSPKATLMLSAHDRHLSCRSSEGQSHLEVRLVTPLMQQLGANLPETSGRLRTFKMSLHLSSRTFFSPDTTATNSAFFFFFFYNCPQIHIWASLPVFEVSQPPRGSLCHLFPFVQLQAGSKEKATLGLWASQPVS